MSNRVSTWSYLAGGFLVVLLLATSLAYGFSDPELARAAQRYRTLLEGSRPAVPAASLHERLAAALKAQQWPRAIAALEGLIGSGDNGPATWLQLARTWPHTSDQPQYLQRAEQAAYNALQSATTAKLQSRALAVLGALYQEDNSPQQALAAWRAALALHDDAALARRAQALQASLRFHVKGVEVENDSATPRICLNFSQPLARSAGIHFGDYLTIQPTIQTVVSAHDARLCIAGVSFGQSYQINVRPGVPAADGSRSASAESFTAAVGNRPARVGFRGNAYVLPRLGHHSLPLTTVNVAQVRLTLLRINDRNLTSQINAGNILGSLDGYARQQIAERSGEELWHGTLDITGDPNQEITTAVPLDPILAHTAPGIYIVTAADARQPAERWHDLASQWLVVSDIGITVLRGSDGLHVFLRSLASAQPLAGVTLRLYARNNGALGQATTDDAGHARFAPGLLAGSGGREPAALMAYAANGDFDFLDLTQPAFDLSDRGVAGRTAPGPVDAYLYSDRGVYRPGETVQLMALVRDSRGRALVQSLPLTVRLLRPDQVESQRLTLKDVGQGGYHAALALPANAPTGSWQIRAYVDPAAAPVGTLDFQVEDFEPQRLRLKLAAAAEQLLPGQPVTVDVSSEYLYGAPAAHLGSSAELVLQTDPKPYPGYPDYRFGLAEDRFDAQRSTLSSGTTDASGNTQLTLLLNQRPTTSLPLQARLRVTLFDPGGRAVNQTLTLPYRFQPYAIGIKPLFGTSIAQGQNFAFDLLALAPDGKPRAVTGLHYVLYRENYDYYWYYQSNRWDYKRIVRDSQPLTSGQLDLTASAPLRLPQHGLDWGSYRLEVYDPASNVASSLRFQVGWFATPASAGTPDQLQLTLDQTSYQPGTTARVHLQAPFAGEALLTVASDKLWLSRSIHLPADGATVDLPVDPAWSPGVYVLASAFRPAADHGRGPGRAVGVAWLALDTQPRTLTIKLPGPAALRPRQHVELPVSVAGLAPGQPAYLTLAAVDEGILQLTDFTSPDPIGYFLGKRRLGLDLLDLYGRLINPGGRPGQLRNGAGADNRNLNAGALHSTRTVALFSGPLRLDGDGQARIPLQLPDFNGELRLMAVAWSGDRYGALSQPLKVRDPLVAELYRPRFLAPGDAARITLDLHDLSAPAGSYQVRLAAAGALGLNDGGARQLQIGAQGASSEQREDYTLQGRQVGSGQLTLTISGAHDFQLTRHWALSVRPAQTYASTHHSQQLAAGASLRLDRQQLSAYLPATGRLSVSFSSHPSLNVPGLLSQLERYPYGCLEQLASRALALLYYGPLARAWHTGSRTDDTLADAHQLVQTMIQRILSMQRYEGGFGLWNANDPAAPWLSAYAMDLLTRARAAGYLVPASPYQRGLDWLRQRLGDDDFRPPALAARAYALYVLSRTDSAPLGELRYLYDNYLDQLPTRLARAQLGVALARYGDHQRARHALRQALQAPPAASVNGDYGSALRDQAALVALLAESGLFRARLPALAEHLAERYDQRRYTSTQEQAWLLLAAHALASDHSTLQLAVDHQPVTATDPYYLQPSVEQLDRGVTVTNRGSATVWVRMDASGVPLAPQPALQQGFAISRRYYTRNGHPVDPTRIPQNTLLVAIIDGKALTEVPRQTLVVDLLPAGFELENADLAHNASLTELAWLPQLTEPAHQELRADRYVATLDLDPHQRTFTLAYLVRAVTPGSYTLPAPYVEAMYQPWLFGRGQRDHLTIP